MTGVRLSTLAVTVLMVSCLTCTHPADPTGPTTQEAPMPSDNTSRRDPGDVARASVPAHPGARDPATNPPATNPSDSPSFNRPDDPPGNPPDIRGAAAAAARASETNPAGEVLEVALFGGGCFWCTEAVYRGLDGVESVMPGYAGGTVENPTYESVCTGKTGHAEVIQIRFDPRKISYAELLEVFWASHDPTTLNRQGNDVGPQYRSVIFTYDEQQRQAALASRQAAEESGLSEGPIVTEVSPFSSFYPAEEYHRDYYARNPSKPYCTYVIAPKLEKFREQFRAKLKGNR
ncbi:MAG: peptide-methionine (S)-S-oxide reductase MsrA [Planctomycetota bacterium]